MPRHTDLSICRDTSGQYGMNEREHDRYCEILSYLRTSHINMDSDEYAKKMQINMWCTKIKGKYTIFKPNFATDQASCSCIDNH